MQRYAPAETDPTAWLTAALHTDTAPQWLFSSDGSDPAHERSIESSYTVSNGFLGIRASLEFPAPQSLPRTYVAGLFDNLPGPIITPALLSAPDWLPLTVTVDGEAISRDSGTLLAETRTLDIQRGLLLYHLRWRSPGGCTVDLQTLRFAAQTLRALAFHGVSIAVDQPCQLDLHVGLGMAHPPVEFVRAVDDMSLWRTAQTAYTLAMTHTATLHVGPTPVPMAVVPTGWHWQWSATAGQPARLTRFVTIACNKSESDSQAAALTAQHTAGHQGMAAVYRAHVAAWATLWEKSDCVLGGDAHAQRSLRFALYHLLSATNSEDPATAVGARALTGDGYFGHVFWDTPIFLLPFYTFVWPQAARAMLMYYYHTLPAARRKATRLGYRGAFYAWESADTGDEATPRGMQGRDGTEIVFTVATQETHISADIAYALWQYYRATHDIAFLYDVGAEIIIETARFWGSRASCTADGQYHITGVIGPDEYHEDVNDNAYTNALACWNMERGLEVAALLAERVPQRWAVLRDRLALTDGECAQWRTVITHMVTERDPQTAVIAQFAGYFGLEYIDLATFHPFAPTMDAVLGRERIQHSQVIKQADVVMLLAVLWSDLSPEIRRTNFDYYAARSSHGSSLSLVMHALVAARLNSTTQAVEYYQRAAAIDQGDSLGNTANGVHIATQGGLWLTMISGFAGLSMEEDALRFDPHLPLSWHDLTFRVQWRGQDIKIGLSTAPATFTAHVSGDQAVTLKLGDRVQSVAPGQLWTCRWDTQTQQWQPTEPRRDTHHHSPYYSNSHTDH